MYIIERAATSSLEELPSDSSFNENRAQSLESAMLQLERRHLSNVLFWTCSGAGTSKERWVAYLRHELHGGMAMPCYVIYNDQLPDRNP